MPQGDEERLFRWSEAAIPGATDWSEDERNALLGEMTVELLGLAAARRQEPRDDVVSMLATYEEDGESLTDDELGMFLIQLLVAGNETTRNAISGALVALAEHPEQLDRLAADPSLLPTAVEEVLRWTTPVTSFMRTAVDDTDLGGTPIAAGDPLLLIYAAANRDEAEFGPTAGTFDVGRSPNHHVALGHGPHFCLGAALARLELTVVLEGVAARWRRLDGGRTGRAQRLVGDLRHQGGAARAGAAVSDSLDGPPRPRHRRWRGHRRGHRAASSRLAARRWRCSTATASRATAVASEIGGHALDGRRGRPGRHHRRRARGGRGDGRAHRRDRQRRHRPQQAAARVHATRSGASSSGVNLDGTFHTLRAAIPILLEAGAGNLVTVATLNATRPLQGEAPYSAAKAGVVNLTATAALEYAPDDPGQLRVARDDRHRPHVGDHRRPRLHGGRRGRHPDGSHRLAPTTWPR